MKKRTIVKITVLFLIFSYAISALIISIKELYVSQREEQLLNDVQEIIDNTQTEETQIFENGAIGIIKIPSLEIEAPIYEGASLDVLKYSVGHFEGSSLWDGNVVLCSHNRGSYAHYFSKINEMENDEEIIYITNMGERRYKVQETKIIEETDLSVLENTKENTITLITCVTSQRNKRLCVIGKIL